MANKHKAATSLPEIGDIITLERALKLCDYFSLEYLVDRIKTNPGGYKNWKFDGCSGIPDEFMGFFTGCDWKDITYKCCLPHDLCYAYGKPGNSIERKSVDVRFYKDLVTKAGMSRWCASAFLFAVRMGGMEKIGLSFSWGFASIV